MIELKEISAEEARKLNSEQRTAYWATPIALTICLLLVTLLLNWLFDAPWSVFWWGVGGLFAIFAIVRLVLGKQPQITAGMVKIIRQGTVIEVVHKGNQPTPGLHLNLNQHTDITLAADAPPEGWPDQHTFTVYRTLGMPYYKQDSTIRYRKLHLIGKKVEIEYLPDSGTVIAYRELDPASDPPTVYVRWGSIQLSGKKALLNQNRVYFVAMTRDPYGNAGLFLRSDSVRDELYVPYYAKNLNRLEEWLFALDGFDQELYTQFKENPPVEEQFIWERRVKEGVSYQSVYAGERVSLMLGSIHVYRDNGHNESISTKEVDYIAVNSFCADKPNTEFFINIRSFRQSGFSVQSRAVGFSKIERWMEQLPGFDGEQYRATKATVGEEAKLVWLRQPVANARLTNTENPSPAISDLGRGILLENKDLWLEWGTFRYISRLDTKRWVAMKHTRYPNSNVKGYTYVIKTPVILGGLEVEALQTESPFWWPGGKFNPDWPVTSYWADVSFGQGGLDDFEQLKRHFSRLIGKADVHADPSIDGENILSASWSVGRATLKISTWKPYQLDVFRNSCRLEIKVKPDVAHLYTDDYTRKLKQHEHLRYLLLKGKLAVASDYTQYPHCRYTPTHIAGLIQTDDEYVIWIDEQHAKIGFASKQYAHILDRAHVDGLALTGLYWRDSPSELQIHFIAKNRKERDTHPANYLGALAIKEGDSQWPRICTQWENFLGIPCHYAEDRQYY